MSSEEEEDKLLEVLDFTREKKDEQNYKGSQNKSKTLKEEEKIIEVPDFTRYLNKNIQRSITNFKEETSKNRKGKIIKMIGVGDPSQDIPTIFKKMNSSRNLLPKLKIIEEAHNEEIDNTKSSIRKR